MGAWLADNYVTVIVCSIVLVEVALAIISIVKDKKKGKSACGCSCSGCPMSGSCHKQ